MWSVRLALRRLFGIDLLFDNVLNSQCTLQYSTCSHARKMFVYNVTSVVYQLHNKFVTSDKISGESKENLLLLVLYSFLPTLNFLLLPSVPKDGVTDIVYGTVHRALGLCECGKNVPLDIKRKLRFPMSRYNFLVIFPDFW